MRAITDEDAIFAATVAEATGVSAWKLHEVYRGANPATVYTDADRRALSRYAAWAAESRRIKRIEAEVRARHLKARTVFDDIIFHDDPQGHLLDLFLRYRTNEGGSEKCQD